MAQDPTQISDAEHLLREEEAQQAAQATQAQQAAPLPLQMPQPVRVRVIRGDGSKREAYCVGLAVDMERVVVGVVYFGQSCNGIPLVELVAADNLLPP